MNYDRPDFAVEYEQPRGGVVPITQTQRAMMHRSFTLQAEMAERAGETKDAARWRKLAEGLQ